MDTSQFAAAYRDYLPKVLNFIRLRVPDEGVAQDLTGATFEQAFRKLGQLRNDDAFAGWLFRIARNEVGQFYRRPHFRGSRRSGGGASGGHPRESGSNPRESGGQVSLDDLLDLPDRSETPFEAAARREQLSAVLEAIAGLPQREQEILALRFVAGLSNHEIGQAMGLSDSNAGVILFRTIRKLRDRLGVDEEREL